jgi:hypothetical protein
MKKLLVTLTILMVALTAIGYSYACYNGGININPNSNFDVAFTNVTVSDNEAEIHVATVQAQITPDGNTINAYITNAYPCYEATITYTIQNKGKRPARFDSLTITNPNPEALKITTTDHTYTWLQPGQTIQGTITAHILQKAKENWQYTFQISIGLSCKEEHPRTIGFWKNQFSAAISQTESKEQIASVTLEHYLDQITGDSNVFDFAGNREQKFQQALSILDMPRRPTMEDKLKAQLLALWLNYVAGWTAGYTVEGMTAWQIIQGSETALVKRQTNQYEYWKNLCDKFNNLE